MHVSIHFFLVLQLFEVFKMEEEEEKWHEGPTVEDVLSSVLKSKRYVVIVLVIILRTFHHWRYI